MPTKAIYQPVSLGGEEEHDEHPIVFDFGDDDFGDGSARSASSSSSSIMAQEPAPSPPIDSTTSNKKGGVHPMEIEGDNDQDNFSTRLFDFQDPWLPTALLIVGLTMPMLILLMHTFYNLIGAWFVATPLALHLVWVLLTARHLVSPSTSLQSRASRLFTSVAACVDNIVLGLIYPTMTVLLIRNFFTDLDGTEVVEWSMVTRRLRWATGLGVVGTVARGFLGVQALGLRAATAAMQLEFASVSPTVTERCFGRLLLLQTHWSAPFLYLDSRLQKWLHCCIELPTRTTTSPRSPSQARTRIRRHWQCGFNVALTLAVELLVVCLHSAVDHLISWPVPPVSTNVLPDCDPLDETECWLPFPSFHAMVPDNTTVTGWRVRLEGRLLPPLKSGHSRRRAVEMQPKFLNRLDGFSTMAPMLFYLHGLKEAHEAGLAQLPGPDKLEQSTTAQSVTLLLDVEDATLMAHSAEIDYLDGPHPVVLLFPAEPLRHNRHYAVAVVNAATATGQRLRPTRGMQQLQLIAEDNVDDNYNDGTTTMYDPQRRQRYRNVVIPALQEAASWLDIENDADDVLQLLFDFHTISAESQLGPVRAVRDATVQFLESSSGNGGEHDAWDWNNRHVRTVRQIDYDCRDTGATLARTVHAELDVPWFLEGGYGGGGRAAVLASITTAATSTTKTAITKTTMTPVGLGIAKLLVHIPCSLRHAALEEDGGKPLRAVVEYGHGLFGHRGEAMEIVTMAHSEGYMVVSMDWRGMSIFDLLHIAKVLISTPRLFEAVRDNLIQGYANKFALQHFCRHGLLQQDWLHFAPLDATRGTTGTVRTIPTYQNQAPSHVFYGISQGGILGAGYTALSGVTHWIDRAVLGSPGTPFAMILARSLQFYEYDKLLLWNFYENRHVRLLLSLVQMAWDSVEASGVLARPVIEPVPPTLIQTGLGDVIVPTIAAEALARAYHATTVPANPRLIFGVPVIAVGNNDDDDDNNNNNNTLLSSASSSSNATLTEVMYDNEYLGLPMDNTAAQGNAIHICLRWDEAMLAQLTRFMNTGTVIDPCAKDGCHRDRIQC